MLFLALEHLLLGLSKMGAEFVSSMFVKPDAEQMMLSFGFGKSHM